MTDRNPPLTADDAFERRKAERRLELLDVNEETAVQAETEPHERLRLAFAERYRNLIGVMPERRHEFRSRLTYRTDDMKVDWIVEALNRDEP